jgi:hypothetical protein
MRLYDYALKVAELKIGYRHYDRLKDLFKATASDIDCRLADTGTELEQEYLKEDSERVILSACRKAWRFRW